VGTRWLGTLRNPEHATPEASESAPLESSSQVLIPSATTSWRAWLATGVRRAPIDRRRARGSDARLKNVLLGGPSGAVDFSSAMARQAVDEAMNELPSQHRQVVKLAYFAGLTNRQIASQLGLTLSGVRRRLRESLAIIGDYVERGRAAGRRAVHGLVFWLAWRRAEDAQTWSRPGLDQVVQAGVVAVMTVAAAAILITHHTSPVQPAHHHKAPRISAVGSSPQVSTLTGKTVAAVASPLVPAATAAPVATVATVVDALHHATAVVSLPISIPVPVGLPVSVPVPLPVPSPSL